MEENRFFCAWEKMQLFRYISSDSIVFAVNNKTIFRSIGNAQVVLAPSLNNALSQNLVPEIFYDKTRKKK